MLYKHTPIINGHWCWNALYSNSANVQVIETNIASLRLSNSIEKVGSPASLPMVQYNTIQCIIGPTIHQLHASGDMSHWGRLDTRSNSGPSPSLEYKSHTPRDNSTKGGEFRTQKDYFGNIEHFFMKNGDNCVHYGGIYQGKLLYWPHHEQWRRN